MFVVGFRSFNASMPYILSENMSTSPASQKLRTEQRAGGLSPFTTQDVWDTGVIGNNATFRMSLSAQMVHSLPISKLHLPRKYVLNSIQFQALVLHLQKKITSSVLYLCATLKANYEKFGFMQSIFISISSCIYVYTYLCHHCIFATLLYNWMYVIV